jgi:hypothetical protein
MSSKPDLTTYLFRDSLMRWRGRPSLPLARFATALCLALTALLVLASFALAEHELEQRISAFGLDAMTIRSPLRRLNDPAPEFPELSRHGHCLTLKLTYSRVQLDAGGTAALALADGRTLLELARMGARADALPVLLTTTLPADMPVQAGVGSWWTQARTAVPPANLRALALTDLLVATPGDFPALAAAPGVAVTLFVRRAGAPPLDNLVAAVNQVLALRPRVGPGSAEVQSSLPLLHELRVLQHTSARYSAFIALALALTVALVFASGAILEYETTVYTTALLRSLGVRRRLLWLQRAGEAVVIANLGGVAAMALASVVTRCCLPQLSAYGGTPSVLLPVALALNGGALLAALPVAAALRRPVGLILP